MATKFNIFTGTLDLVDEGGTQWLPPVATEGDLPLTDADGSARVVRATDAVYVFDAIDLKWHKQSPEIGSFSATPTASGLSVAEVDSGDITSFSISLHPADATNPGAVSTTAQTFAGDKTFQDDVIVTGDFTVNGTTTTINTTTLNVTDANITVNDGGNQATANTNVAGLTVEMSDATDVRFGYDSSLASKFKLGEVGSEVEVADVSSVQTLTNKVIDADNNTISNLAHGAEVDNPSSGVHGVTGNVVGTTDTQTLTNKTIDANLNTISNLAHGAEVDDPSSGVHGVTGSIVGTSDTQTLTNKTIVVVNNTITTAASGNLVATELNSALAELQGDIDTRANQSLSNLTNPTSINQSLIPNGASYSLGSPGTDIWATVESAQLNLYNRNDNVTDIGYIYGDTNRLVISAFTGDETDVLFEADGQIDINTVATNNDSFDINIFTGNATTSSGNILIQTGSGTTRGQLTLDSRKIILDSAQSIDLTTQQRITNVSDPTSDQDVATKAYVDSNTSFITGDIQATTFSITNNQASAANITGFAFANATTRSFSAHVDVRIDADADLYETFEIKGIQKASDWEIGINSIGDDSQVIFSITSAGQLQYTSGNYAGFVSGSINFRAITLGV